MGQKYRRLLMIVVLCGIARALVADVVGIRSFIDETETILQWDSFRQQGLIWKNNDVIAFVPDNDYVVFNYTQRIEIDRISYAPDGRLLLSDSTYETLKKIFSESTSPQNNVISAIFIDAGHGGKDSGAVGNFVDRNNNAQRIYEKDVVLSVANTLGEKLTAQFPHKNIILSRSRDIFLSLQQRTKLANAVRVGAEESILFISIHANASLNTAAAGYEVWYLPPEYRRKNLIDAHTVGVKDSDVLSILNSIKGEEYTIESVLLAQRILIGLDDTIGSTSKNRGIKQESWFVVRQAKMPSVLAEVGFVSNPREAALLKEDSHLQKIADGIYNGIVTFVDDFE